MTLEVGNIVLDRYKLISVLGQGGMGRVYLAEHVRLATRVALKVLLRHEGMDLGRFRSEAELMARISHPNTVALLDYGETSQGQPVLAMEYVEGVSLADHIDEHLVVAWPFAAEIVAQALDGLEAAHGVGIVHRDIKPSNVLVTCDEPLRAKLADFGIAKAQLGQKHTATGVIVGTPDYMAPEVLAGRAATPASDVYAMGCTLYEAVVGRCPFEGDEVLARFEKDAPRAVAPAGSEALPRSFVELVARALERRAPDRQRSADDLAAELRHVLRENRASPSKRPSPSKRSSPAAVARRAPTERRGLISDSLAAIAAVTPEPAGVANREVEPQRDAMWLLVAALPSSRLARSDERRFLNSLVGPRGRGYSMGGILWFAMIEGADAEAEVGRLREALASRYGSSMRALASEVPEDFRLSTKQLAGAAPLPPPLPELIARITS